MTSGVSIERPAGRMETNQEDAAAAGRSFGADYAAFDCRVNAYSVDDLFSGYRRSRFLYPEKARRLQPHWSTISCNWERAQRGGS